MSDTTFRIAKVAAPLRQQVVEGIRRAITTGHFRGGARLVERDLCEMAGVSRTLIREALRQLETEGLVKVIPNKGPVVVAISPDEAKKVYQVRAELEGLASRLFAEHASPAQIAGLKQAMGDLKRAYASGDTEAVSVSKTAFYDHLVEGSGNEILAAMLRQLHSRAILLRATSLSQPGRMVESEAEIGRMVDAIVRRDAEGARSASITHVNRAAEVAITLLERDFKTLE